jgi:opacity protein-like surface antigen
MRHKMLGGMVLGLVLAMVGWAGAVPVGDVVEKGQWVLEVIYSRSQLQDTVTNGLPLRVGWGVAEGVELRGGSTFSDSPGGQSTSYLMAVKWQVSEQHDPNHWADVAVAVPVTFAPAASVWSGSILLDASQDMDKYTPYLCFGMSGTMAGAEINLTFPFYVGVDYHWSNRLDIYGHLGASASDTRNSSPTIIEIGVEAKI